MDEKAKENIMAVSKATIFTTALIGVASTLAFNFGTRKEILRRDHYTCTCCGKSWKDGYMVQAAHDPDLHGKGNNDPDFGRTLCTEDHILEELGRGNYYGARKLWENQTIRNFEWIRENGGVDDKPDFQYYLDLSDGIVNEP